MGLKNLALDVLGVEMKLITDLIGRGARQKTFDQVPIEDATPYAAADADMTARLRGRLEPSIDQQNLSALMQRNRNAPGAGAGADAAAGHQGGRGLAP